MALVLGVVACDDLGTQDHAQHTGLLCVGSEGAVAVDGEHRYLFCQGPAHGVRSWDEPTATACAHRVDSAMWRGGEPIALYGDLFTCWDAADRCIDEGDCPEGISLTGWWRDHRTGETLIDGQGQGYCQEDETTVPLDGAVCDGNSYFECYWGGLQLVACPEGQSCTTAGEQAVCQ